MTRSELAALLIACVFHVGALRVARSMPDRNLLFERAPGIEEPIEIDVEAREEAPAPQPEVPADPPRDVAEQPEEATAEDAAAAVTPADTAERGAADSEPDAQAAPGNASAPPGPESAGPAEVAALPAPGSPDEYGPPPEAPGPAGPLAGPLWTMPGGLDLGPAPAAPTRTPRAKAVDAATASDVIASTLRDADRAAGITLPSTAVVTSAVSTATRSVPVPHNTRATFEVKLGAGGKVVSSRVVKHSGGDKAQWDAAAKSVAASLASRSLDIGQAKNATVIVNVTTKHVYPSGTAKAADVKPVCANQIINDLADGMDKKIDVGPDANIPIFTDENGRPCIPIGMAGISDTANIGATKQVQVQTSSTVLIDGKKALPASTPKVNKDPFWADTGKGGPRPVMPFKMRKYKRDKEKKK